MPRKKHHPILGKAMAFLALSLSPMAKAKGPISRKLLLLKKRSNRGSTYKLFRHYNYAYIGEYQFSPSNSPLIRYAPGLPSSSRKTKKKRTDVRVVLSSLLCGGERDVSVVDALSLAPAEGMEREMYVEEWEGDGEEDGGDPTVDRRAERFIERFYEEIRLQRQASLALRREMVQ